MKATSDSEQSQTKTSSNPSTATSSQRREQSCLPQKIIEKVKRTFTSFSLLHIYIYTLNGEGNRTPLQYSCLENPQATVHGVAKSRTRLSDFNFTFHFHALEKEMATHSSILAWRIPGTEEPSGLPSMGSHRVGPD